MQRVFLGTAPEAEVPPGDAQAQAGPAVKSLGRALAES